MRRILLRCYPLCVRHFHSSNTFKPISTKLLVLPLTSTQSNFKFFSSDNDHSYPNPNEKALISSTQRLKDSSDIEDVSNEDFFGMLENFYQEEDENEEAIPKIMEAILKRRLSGKHEDTDDELLDDLKRKNSLKNVRDEDCVSELDGSGTDEEGGDLQSENSDSEDSSGDRETESD
ncbi:hypothetical protein FRX31_024811 [Thalictrum thalictroides]|uniref:Uncharacterized protein n=1 Tax=Thalictrum thalictroides TaxID=46969 RepID=A0A7J6VN61_THATH|nr:hypothetical protein FRX31_024811 [Thalictrum thalictroides]